MIKRKSPKAREPKVEGHPTKWSVVVFHGAGLGTIGLYAKCRTKLEADAATTKVKDGVRPDTARRLDRNGAELMPTLTRSRSAM
jgi:hypothetical protein